MVTDSDSDGDQNRYWDADDDELYDFFDCSIFNGHAFTRFHFRETTLGPEMPVKGLLDAVI